MRRRWYLCTGRKLDQLKDSMHGDRCRHSYATGYLKGSGGQGRSSAERSPRPRQKPFEQLRRRHGL